MAKLKQHPQKRFHQWIKHAPARAEFNVIDDNATL
jgi:hypothetical protein